MAGSTKTISRNLEIYVDGKPGRADPYIVRMSGRPITRTITRIGRESVPLSRRRGSRRFPQGPSEAEARPLCPIRSGFRMDGAVKLGMLWRVDKHENEFISRDFDQRLSFVRGFARAYDSSSKTTRYDAWCRRSGVG